MNIGVLTALCAVLLFGGECESKHDLEFSPLDNLPSNEAGKLFINLFKYMIYGSKTTDLTKQLDRQMATYTTATSTYMLVRSIFENTEHLHEMTTLTTALADLSVLFDKIDDTYAMYEKHRNSKKDITDKTLLEFVRESRNLFLGPLDYYRTIYSKVVPKNIDVSSAGVGYMSDVSILSLMYHHMQSYKNICGKFKSQQQIIHILYMSVILAQIKVYSIMEFSYAQLEKAGECDYHEEMTYLKDELKTKLDNTREMFEYFMGKASREVWRCDPKENIENGTYVQLYELFQKYVISDENMDADGKCSNTCSDYKNAEQKRCARQEEYYDTISNVYEESICDQHRKCNGDLNECEDYFKTYNELWICPSDLKSTRRYEFMIHGKIDNWFGKHTITKLGRDHKLERNDCKRTLSYDDRDTGKGFKDIIAQCEICLCTCRDHKSPTSEKYINVRPAVADNDYVVTGVRLVKHTQTLHIQIEQGMLLPNGQVDEGTVHWKDIALDETLYHRQTISWTTYREVYLGITELPKDRVVVGVKFAGMKDHRGHWLLGLRTLSVPYDYYSGKLTYTNKYYTEVLKPQPSDPGFDSLPDIEHNPIPDKDKIELKDVDVPIYAESPSMPHPNSKKTVKFVTSDFQKDLGQTLVPFIDIQDVTTRPAVPLSGIGFYYKNTADYGGYLGIKLMTYDITPYV